MPAAGKPRLYWDGDLLIMESGNGARFVCRGSPISFGSVYVDRWKLLVRADGSLGMENLDTGEVVESEPTYAKGQPAESVARAQGPWYTQPLDMCVMAGFASAFLVATLVAGESMFGFCFLFCIGWLWAEWNRRKGAKP